MTYGCMYISKVHLFRNIYNPNVCIYILRYIIFPSPCFERIAQTQRHSRGTEPPGACVLLSTRLA